MIIDSIEEQLRAEQLGMTMTVVKTGLKSALDSIDYSKYCGMFLIATEVMRDEFSALDSIPIPLWWWTTPSPTITVAVYA